MRAPWFWDRDGLVARLLGPAGAIGAAATARRVARPGFRAAVPVICCGNASVGGAGKTLLALDLMRRLAADRRVAHALTRGFGGRAGGVIRVDPLLHDAAAVGDEALLLAAAGPCWVAADRAAAARAAVDAGADVLVMDDGLQNPGLVKDLSFLVVDAAAGFGNGRVLPAGPLREPVVAAAARCQAAVVIGEGVVALPAGLPVLRARLAPDRAMRGLRGVRVLAFAGIGRPGKFFASLEQAGAVVTGAAFGDHHRYTARELDRLWRRAEREALVLTTTPKDAARLPAARRGAVVVAGVDLDWADEPTLGRLLAAALR